MFNGQNEEVDPNLTGLVNKYGLNGKIDWRVDSGCREATQGECVITFVSIKQPGALPAQPPAGFIREAMPLLTKIHNRHGKMPVSVKIHPTGMTLEEIKQDQHRFAVYCEQYNMD